VNPLEEIMSTREVKQKEQARIERQSFMNERNARRKMLNSGQMMILD